MDEELLDNLQLGAELEVKEPTECPEGAELHPTHKQTRADVVVTMETRKLEEEERWRRLFPDIKECVIVIVRPSPSQLKMVADRRRSERLRSCDPWSEWEWMQPLEPNNGVNGSSRFVKKVEVKIQAEHAPADGSRKPQRRLKLTRCPSVVSDSAHRQLHINNTNNEDFTDDPSDHNYCLHTERPNSPEFSSQSQDSSLTSSCGLRDEELSCSSAEKNPPSIVLKKVRGHRWILRSSQGQEEPEEDVEEQMQLKRETADEPAPGLKIKKRRVGCRRCAPCLRKDCRECVYCRDMKKYGGPSRLKQKCRFRRCENIGRECRTEPDHTQLPEATVTTATLPEPHHLRKSIAERDAAKRTQVNPRRKWAKMWREKQLKFIHDRVQAMKEEEQLRDRTADEKEVKRRRGQGSADRKSRISQEWNEPIMKDDEEEEKTETPQLPVGPSGRRTGTHLQVDLTLDGSHLPPHILSDSALTCLPGLLPQEGSVLRVSTGLTFSPAPASPAAVQSVRPKEEEEPVEVDLHWKGGAGRWKEEEEPVEVDLHWKGGAGRWKEEEEPVEEVRAEGVSDRGRFYDVVVTLPDNDEETLMATSPNMSDVTESVAACDITGAVDGADVPHERPEFLSLNSWSFKLFGGGASHSLAGGRSLLRLLHALRKAVLPAHWVAVLADGPELQLLQCSRLSSMTGTIVHVQSDRCFYISVQNQQLPETHRVYEAHTHPVSHLSQLMSLLLHLEQLVVCRGFKVRPSACRQQVRSAACHLLVAPPLYTCLPCLLEEELEEEEEESEESEEDES